MNLTKAKAYAALVGAVATGLLGVFAGDSTLGKVLTVVAAVATGFATYKVPNKPKSEADPHAGSGVYFRKGQGGYADVGLILLILTFVGVVLLLFRVHFGG